MTPRSGDPTSSPIREIVSHRILAGTTEHPTRDLATGTFFGDSVRSPEDMRAAIAAYQLRFGALPALVKTYHSLEDDFSPDGKAGQLVRSITAHPGVMPLVSLEPTWYGSPEEALLDTIAGGGVDDRLVRFARGIAEGDTPVGVEFASEMNARFQAPWQAELNGGEAGPAAFVRAWRHLVHVARDVGAFNVRWVFAPSAGNPYTHHPTGPSHWNWYGYWYPGDDFVDYLGIHLFNHATDQGAWVPFVELVSGDAADHILDDMSTRFPDLGVIIGEFATSEHPERPLAKAEWIIDAYDRMRRCPNVAAAVWFDMDKEADWHIGSSPSAARAYRAAVGGDSDVQEPLPAAD